MDANGHSSLAAPDERSAWRTEARALFRLGLPIALAQAGINLMGVVDVAVVGRLGEVELAGVGLANALYFPVFILGMGIMLGVDPLASQAFGAGEPLRARRLLWQGVWLSIVVSAVLALPIALLPALLEPFGISAPVAAAARAYLFWRLPGMPAMLLFVAVRSYLQAAGIARPVLISTIVANIFNLFADILLVFGGGILPDWCGPLRSVPALGVIGAAIATVLCGWLQVAIVAAAVRRMPLPAGAEGFRRFDRGVAAQAMRIGSPVGLQMMAEVGVFALVGLLAGRLGTRDLAAHQIAITLASFSFTLAVGVGAAGSVRVGRAIGAGDAAGTRIAGMMAFIAGAGVMGTIGLFFFLVPRLVARLLTSDPGVIAATAPLLVVAAVFQISDGIQGVGAGVLRGAGDTRFTFAANLLGHWLIGLPVALVLGFHFKMGIVGLWWGLCVGLSVVAVLLFRRFRRLSSRAIAPLEHGGARH